MSLRKPQLSFRIFYNDFKWIYRSIKLQNFGKKLPKPSTNFYKGPNFQIIAEKCKYLFPKLKKAENVKILEDYIINSKSEVGLLFLSMLYAEGKVVPMNPEKSKEFLKTVLEINKNLSIFAADIYFVLGEYKIMKNYLPENENRFFYYGWMYMNGRGGFRKDYESAMYYFKQNPYDMLCAFHLGLIYQKGYKLKDKIIIQKDDEKAIEYFKIASEYGYPNAKIKLGKMLLNRIGSEKDIEMGIQILKETKEKDSHFELGKYYYTKNDPKSFEYFWLALSYGRKDAGGYIGEFYLLARPPISKVDYKKAIYYFECNPENEKSIFHMVELIKKGFKNVNTKKLIETLKKYTSSFTNFYLGIVYLKAHDVKDLNKAYYHIRRAYEFGIKESAEYLISMLINGIGCEKDINFAKEVLKDIQDEKKIKKYNFDIGFYYYTIEKNYEFAKEYFEKSSHGESYYFLGQIYQKGLGVDIDLKKSFEYYKIFHRIYPTIGGFYTGCMLLKGEGCNKDEKNGIKILNKLNDDKSNYVLGLHYLNQKDYQNSFTHFKRASEYETEKYLKKSFHLKTLEIINDPLIKDLKGNIYYYLGIMYQEGLGVEQDQTKAKDYFEISVKKGNTEALKYLEFEENKL